MLYDRKPKRVDAVKNGDNYLVHDLAANVTLTMPAAEFEMDFTPVGSKTRQTKLGHLIEKTKDKVQGKGAGDV